MSNVHAPPNFREQARKERLYRTRERAFYLRLTTGVGKPRGLDWYSKPRWRRRVLRLLHL